MIIRKPTLFVIVLVIVITPFLLPKITWLARSKTTEGSVRFIGKNYSGQITHTYSVIRFEAGMDTFWFNSGDNIIFKEGESVPVRYEVNNPSDARVNIFADLWGDTLVYGAGPFFILLVVFFHPKGVPKRMKLLVNYKK
ncbi:MAG: DUF3592 domain-containing protein, partial [Bacteroidota bacterium]